MVLRVEGAEHFVVDVATGLIYDLNETAAFVFGECKTGGTFGELVDRMEQRYEGVPRAELERDLAEILDQFVANRFGGPR